MKMRWTWTGDERETAMFGFWTTYKRSYPYCCADTFCSNNEQQQPIQESG